MSPDGASLYSAGFGGDTVAAFSRSAGTGALSFVNCVSAIVISPDGGSVYSAAAGGHAISAFHRDTTTGAITYAGCVHSSGGTPCTSINNTNALYGPFALPMSPDGKQLYSAATYRTVASDEGTTCR
jgi:hypothetical protein